MIYNEINVQWLTGYIEETEDAKVIERTNPYLSEERVEAYRRGELTNFQTNWYVNLYRKGLNYMISNHFWINVQPLNQVWIIEFSLAYFA